MIKPDEFNSKLEELQNNYTELYEMFEYLDKSRDEYKRTLMEDDLVYKQYLNYLNKFIDEE